MLTNILCQRIQLALINTFYTGSTIHGIKLHVLLETTKNNSCIVICVMSNFKTRGIAGGDNSRLLIGTTVIIILKSHNIKYTVRWHLSYFVRLPLVFRPNYEYYYYFYCYRYYYFYTDDLALYSLTTLNSSLHNVKRFLYGLSTQRSAVIGHNVQSFFYFFSLQEYFFLIIL